MTLRVGLIGAGGISRVHAEAWRALGADVTVTSRSGASALAAEYGMRTASDPVALLAQVDVVDILTPSSTHSAFALAAIEAGVPVICEKPLAPTSAEAQRLLDAATASGVPLLPAHVVRYFPAYADIKANLEAGAVGEIETQRLFRRGSAPAPRWFFQENTGGGVIRDLMIHDIDQALWFAGPVVSVSAVQDPPTRDGIVPVPVTAHVTLTHRNGVVSRLEATWGDPDTPFRTGVDVAGSTGTISYRSDADSPLPDAGTGTSTDAGPDAAPGVSPYLLQLADFASALRQGSGARVSGADAVAALEVVEAAYASIAAGAPVRIAAR